MNDHKIKHAAEKSADQATSLLDEASSRFSGLIDDAKDKGEELIETARDRSAEFFSDAQEKGMDAWKDIKSWAQKNPALMIGGGIVVGAVLHALYTRKED